MLSKLLRNRINKLIMALALTVTIMLGNVAYAVSSGIQPFKLDSKSVITYNSKTTPSQNVTQNMINEVSINENMVQNNGMKILIYHSHFCEKTVDGFSVYDIGSDLAKKLKMKGFEVTHLDNDFSGTDYNNSYHASRDVLKELDLSSFSMILDVHFNAGGKANTTVINGNEVAKVSFVNTRLNPNRIPEIEMANGIMNNLNRYSDNLCDDKVLELYNKGIVFYNQDLSPTANMLLIEIGNDKTSAIQDFRSNTYISASISDLLTNK
jgi:stage II sporulation protein P